MQTITNTKNGNFFIKFSDLKSEFELFLFSDLLVSNRENLKVANSFILTLQKDNSNTDSFSRRINVKTFISLNDFTEKKYEKVTIELKENFKINDIKEILSKEGNTEVNLIINKKNQKAYYSLKKNRKFDLNHLEHLKTKEYVVKITF